jgi:predicted RNase H-like nuclease
MKYPCGQPAGHAGGVARVLGVDACRGGWVGVTLDGDGAAVCFGATLAETVAVAEVKAPVDCVAVDIPIGLPDRGRRLADAEVRTLLSPRGSCVFDALPRSVYEAPTHAEANALHRSLTGRGVSQQAYQIGPKVLDANEFARDNAVLEAHPELCFATMGDGPLRAAKKTGEGQQQRRDLLQSQGIDVSALSPGRAGIDDLLDAAAVAWTARRHLRGEASAYPGVPEVFRDGRPAAIWV